MLAQPTTPEITLGLDTAEPRNLEIKITSASAGRSGARLWVDGIVMRDGIPSEQAIDALNEAKRLALCGAYEGVRQLAATLAMRPREQA